ncbi:MAG: hypothetical protein NTX36_06800 [Proteobacteria bacterium]|nr:hypothetical protein [Pseudomonadota bacterium]
MNVELKDRRQKTEVRRQKTEDRSICAFTFHLSHLRRERLGGQAHFTRGIPA